MSVLATYSGVYQHSQSKPLAPSFSSRDSCHEMEHQGFALRSPNPSNQPQPARERRRSLNISHFNALQNAVSNLSRIDDFNLEELGDGFFSDVFKVNYAS